MSKTEESKTVSNRKMDEDNQIGDNKQTIGIDEKQDCGIIMPISPIDDCSADHWIQVKNILSEAIKDAGFRPLLVSEASDSGIIHKRIVQNIYKNEIVVCDVSGKNPNVMFELGMRLAFDKPTIIIIDDKTTYSFDTGQIEHLQYPRNLSYYLINDFKNKLKEKIIATIESAKNPDYTTFLKHFGEFEIAHVEKKTGTIDEVVLSQLNDLSAAVTRLERRISNRSDLPSSLDTRNSVRDNDVRTVIQREIDSYFTFNKDVREGAPKDRDIVTDDILRKVEDYSFIREFFITRERLRDYIYHMIPSMTI